MLLIFLSIAHDSFFSFIFCGSSSVSCGIISWMWQCLSQLALHWQLVLLSWYWVTDGDLSSHRSHWMTCCWLGGRHTLRQAPRNSPRRLNVLYVATSSVGSGCWSATCGLILVKSPSLALVAPTVPTARRWSVVTFCTATTNWRQHKGSCTNHSFRNTCTLCSSSQCLMWLRYLMWRRPRPNDILLGCVWIYNLDWIRIPENCKTLSYCGRLPAQKSSDLLWELKEEKKLQWDILKILSFVSGLDDV